MTEPDVVLCLDVADVNAAIRWWNALAGFRTVAHHAPGAIGERATLRSPSVPALELDLHTCRPRPVTGCTIGSIRSITIRLDDPHAAIHRLTELLGAASVVIVDRSEAAITLRDSSGYHVCVLARRPEGSACAASSPA